MAIYAVKRNDETNERLIKRAKKQWQNSRLQNELRGRKNFKKTRTKRVIRKAALKRSMYRQKRVREQFYA